MANSKSIKKKKISAKVLILSIIILVLIGVIIFLALTKIEVRTLTYPNATKTTPLIEAINMPKFISFENMTMVGTFIPAVDSEGNGDLTILSVESMPGSGRILVDIDNLLFWSDTQQSIRVARNAAANVTGKNLENYDLVYNIYANASIVGGPSAGAAIAVATIAALEKKDINRSVMITGSMNHDGSIGPVGNIIEKAKAARENKASLFLVPLLQSREVVYDITKHCEKFGWTEICTAEQIPRKINVGDEAGIRVIEVENIQEALRYMLK